MTEQEVKDAMDLLRAEIKQSSLRRCAERMFMSPTALSLALNGKYPAKLDKIAARVMEMIQQHWCPYELEKISPITCMETCTSAAPTHHPEKMGRWRTCRTCEHAAKFLNKKGEGNATGC